MIQEAGQKQDPNIPLFPAESPPTSTKVDTLQTSYSVSFMSLTTVVTPSWVDSPN